MALKIEKTTRIPSPEEVRRLTAGCVDPNYKPADKSLNKEPNYWRAEERKKITDHLKELEPTILDLARHGISACTIAKMIGVSRECIARRLRASGAGFMNPPGRAGRPPKIEIQAEIKQSDEPKSIHRPSLAFQWNLEKMTAVSRGFDPQDVVGGLAPEEVEEIREGIQVVTEFFGRVIERIEA